MNMKKRVMVLFLSFIIIFSTFTPVCKGQSSSATDSYYIAEQSVINAWERFSDSAIIADLQIPENEFQSLRNYITNKNPKYFYVEIADRYSCVIEDGKTIIYQLNFIYSFEQQELDDRVAEFENKCKQIIDSAPQGVTPEETLLYFHDYIAEENVYDLRVFEGIDTSDDKFIRSAYGCLVNNKSVCEGISKAFKVLCDKVGIECHIVYSESMRHEWNLVKVGNNYYHIDVTQDAPVYNLGAHGFHQSPGDINHRFFLKSDDDIKNDALGNSVHYSWNAPYKATDSETFKNAFWNSANDGVYYIDGWYYYTTATHFKKHRYYDKTTVNLKKFPNGTWKCGCGNLHVWKGAYSRSTYVSDHRVMFTVANKICCYNIKTKTFSIVYAHTDTGFYYSVAYRDDKFLLAIRDDAYHDGEIHSFFVDVDVLNIEVPGDDVISGDTNGDGEVNVRDIAKMRNYLLMKTSVINYERADVYYDKTINTKDLLYIRKFLSLQ